VGGAPGEADAVCFAVMTRRSSPVKRRRRQSGSAGVLISLAPLSSPAIKKKKTVRIRFPGKPCMLSRLTLHSCGGSAGL